MTTNDPTTTTTTGPMGMQTEFSHPAYATINAARSQGHFRLFGSNISHQGAVVIELAEARMVRTAGREDIRTLNKTIARIALSEAQWASFVSRMNMGTGTPCTVQRVRGGEVEMVPGLPEPESATERLESAAQAMLDESQRKQTAAFDSMRSILDEAKIPAKVKRALAEQIDRAYDHGQVNRDHHHKVLTETNEKLIADAKTEIDAMVGDIVQRLGVSSLRDALALAGPQGSRPPLEG